MLSKVVFHSVFKKESQAMNVISFYFEAMGDFRLGKQSLIFKEFAEELGVLEKPNQAQQKTR